MQNELPVAHPLTLAAFRQAVSDLGIPAREADLDDARLAAEALLRKAQATRGRA